MAETSTEVECQPAVTKTYITNKGAVYYADYSFSANVRGEGWKPITPGKEGPWITTDPVKVYPYLDYCAPDTRKRVEEWYARRVGKVQASMAMDSEIAAPAPPGCEYRGYQKAGIAFMRNTRGCLNADVMRLGKTIQTLGLCNTYDRPLKVLVVCLANGKTHWVREAEKWLVHKTTVAYAEGDTLPSADFVVVNYDILARHAKALKAVEWDIIVADESRRLKNPKSGRSKAFFSIPYPKLHYVFLDGTPITRCPVDLWPLMEACDPSGLGRKWWDYIKTYCGASKENGWDASGATNSVELQYRMRKAFMIRREKRDVGIEMPSERVVLWLDPKHVAGYVPPNDGDDHTKNIQAFMAEATGFSKDTDAQSIDALYQSFMMAFGNDLHALGLAKMQLVADLAKQLLEEQDKLVLFGYNRDVVDGVSALLQDYNCVTVKGGLTTRQRDEAFTKFKEDVTCRVINANLIAAGSSISLKEADTCVLYQLYTPDAVDQAEERVWDLTKTRATTIYYPLLKDTAEEAQYCILTMRRKIIDKIMNRSNLIDTL